MAMFNYESEELYQMARGETIPSSSVYMADCKKEILTEVSPNYPKLTEYEKEWMHFAKNIYEGGTPVPLEYLEVQTYNHATVENVIPFCYKSAILKGQTETICDRFEQGSYSFSVANGTVTDTTPANDRIRIKQPITGVNGRVRIILNNNYEILTGVQDKDGKVVSTGWVTETTKNLVETDKFYFAMKKTDGSNLSPNDLYEAIASVTGYDLFEMKHVKMPVLTTSNEDSTKTNILTVDEEVELRGVGDVKDTLDLMTGEMTQHINEVVLDGSEGWAIASQNYSDGYIYQTPLTLKPITKNNIVCNKMQTKTIWEENTGEGITINMSLTHLQIKHSTITTAADLKAWLASSPLTVHYGIENPIIKTVDLSRMIKPYEGTNNYTVSSDTIPPQLLLSVPIESTGKQTLNDIITEE